MWHKLCTTASLLLLSLTLSNGAEAARYDPDLTWRTIQTEHFNINFHQGEEQLADEFTRQVEDIFETMTEELQWTPKRRTEIVLIDRTDAANGYAQTLPYNTIVIFVTGPQEDSTLSFYDDWLYSIGTHEYTHILHMDTHHGIVTAIRAVIGRIASTNNLSPWWMVEGLATFQETRHTRGGRGRSPQVDMIKRTAVLEDDFPPLGNLDGLQPDPPGGNLRYLFGQDFMQYVADHTGEDVWTRWIHTYGGHIPYVLPAKKVFGKRLVPLYFDWREHLFERYTEQAEAIRAQGIREGRLVSDGVASCTAPRFAPDGEKIVWSCYDRATGSALWLADGAAENPEKLRQDRGAKNFAWRNDSQAFAYAATHVVNRFNTWSDIYMYNLEEESLDTLTNGARARDPDFSPDGSRLLMVTNRVQNNQLTYLTVDRQQHSITENTDHTQYSTPRYSPDGATLAVSVWQNGQRDLWLYSTDAKPLRRLTADIAIDRDPEWSSDGRWLFFSSDRLGVPNIFTISMETERLYQVTNVLTGAVKPSVHPDGTLLAYQQYSADGWDVRALDLNEAEWIDRGLLPHLLSADAPLEGFIGEQVQPTTDLARWDDAGIDLKRVPRHGVPVDSFTGKAQAPNESIDTFDQGKVEDVFGEEQDYPFQIEPKRYNPLPTLAPGYVAPYIQSTPFAPSDTFSAIPFALKGTLATSSADTLRHYGWGGTIHYRTDADYLGWSGALTLNRFLPVYSVGAYSNAVASGILYVVDPEDAVNNDGSLKLDDSAGRYWEKRIEAYAQVSYPYTYKTWVFGRYSIATRDELDALPENTYLPAIPTRGTIGKLSGGWRYSWAQPTAYAISLEDARIFSFVGSVLSPYLGTQIRNDEGELVPLTQLQITSELREYIVNPLIANHVFAFRAAGGLTIGATDYLGNYQLGGSIGDSAFYSTPDEFRMIRGYPFAYDLGDMYWLGGFEYRFPIWRIERGVGTIPAYVRRLSGAVFVDSGNAFGDLSTWQDAFEDSLIGVGAELRLSSVFAWSTGITSRAGYGVGLTPGGYKPTTQGSDGSSIINSRTFYFQVGGSF
jgi:hypothetical protein